VDPQSSMRALTALGTVKARMDIDRALARAEAALDDGSGLAGTGFWKAVDAVRRDRSLADTYGDRIARIDRRAFEQGVNLSVPLGLGLVALTGATGVGVVSVDLASRWMGLRAVVAFLIGTGALLVGTHSLTHFIVGRLLRIRFTHVFLGGPPPPRPGVKTDYASYLRATSRQRAAMHASGAVVTKIVPFALAPIAWTVSTWLFWFSIALGVIQIITDVAISTKVSDWKKEKRELSSR